MFKNEDFGLTFFEKGQILMPLTGLAPSKLKIKKKLRVGYVYLEESFDAIFNMGYGGGAYNAPPNSLLVGKFAHSREGFIIYTFFYKIYFFCVGCRFYLFYQVYFVLLLFKRIFSSSFPQPQFIYKYIRYMIIYILILFFIEMHQCCSLLIYK